MLYAGIDIRKSVFQVVVLDPDSGELSESRFEPSRERLSEWAAEWEGKLAAVAIESTTGWRWVARELEQRGFEVHLVLRTRLSRSPTTRRTGSARTSSPPTPIRHCASPIESRPGWSS